ncbi:MAG TPA: DUF624 domain-containing protein [Clostridiaceae bacterium]|nr:DUF624 domain-containing protein [Clostridiaceae bacterium]
MAGFFGFFDYTKPGPGVEKDAPPKARIIVFFEIFSRKFWNLIKINMLFGLFNLPAIVLVLFASMFIFQDLIAGDALTDLLTRIMIGSVLLCIPVVTIGPAQAGFTYIMRNYAREEHAFIWWDFKENAIKNFKQSIIISLIDLLALILMGIAMNFYFSFNELGIFNGVATGLLIMTFIIFLMMHLYIYPMLVTFKLSVLQIYKNALLFAMLKFLPNLGILVLCTAIILLSFYFPVIGIILLLFITFSFIGLITNFYVYPSLKKYMIDKLEEETEDDEEDEDNEENDNEENEEDDEEFNTEGETEGSNEEADQSED